MRAIAACSLYIFSTRDYGETTCSEKEEFIIICSDAGHRGGGSCAGACHRLCRDNYVLDGTVIDRFPRGESELISFLYKDASGREYIIPICVSAEARNGLNINRDQQYRIEFRVEDINPNVRGVCMATSILPK